MTGEASVSYKLTRAGISTHIPRKPQSHPSDVSVRSKGFAVEGATCQPPASLQLSLAWFLLHHRRHDDSGSLAWLVKRSRPFAAETDQAVFLAKAGQSGALRAM